MDEKTEALNVTNLVSGVWIRFWSKLNSKACSFSSHTVSPQDNKGGDWQEVRHKVKEHVKIQSPGNSRWNNWSIWVFVFLVLFFKSQNGQFKSKNPSLN